ncbi:MAG: molybdenum cofactor guanylyltransferase [Lachnospiraceae bacterium]|nr:molybdenum cofactor guanylyltransferase [Lachnospiraceae bacterium]
MRTEDVSAVILAGGKATRMGSDKAELVLCKKTLLELMVDKLKELGITDIMLSGTQKELPGTRTVSDIYEGRGPAAGVHASLLKAEKPACLVVSVDVPLVGIDTLKELIDAHEGAITALYHNGDIEPLIAVYDRSVAKGLEEVILSGKAAVKRALDQAKVKKVEYTGEEILLTNCNTPGDFDKIKEYAEK